MNLRHIAHHPAVEIIGLALAIEAVVVLGLFVFAIILIRSV